MSPRKNGNANSKPTRRLITIKQKKEIIATYEKGVRIIDLSMKYNMATSTIATILKNKEAIKAARVSSGVKTLSTQRSIYIEEMERQLILWMSERQMCGDSLTQPRVCAKARSIFLELKQNMPRSSCESDEGEDDFKASRGWFQNFRKRIGLLSVDRREESVATYQVDAEKVALECLHFNEDCQPGMNGVHSIPSALFIKQELKKEPTEQENTYMTDDKEGHSSSDDDIHWKGNVPTEDIEQMFYHWEEFQTLALRWHPDKAEVDRVCSLVGDTCLVPFIEILKKRRVAPTLEKIILSSIKTESVERSKIRSTVRRKLKVPVRCPESESSLR